MDKEGIQRQSEDMEGAAERERWRNKERRLNSEIDKLESELAEARAAAKQKTAEQDVKTIGVDPAALLKVQEASEEKLRKASDDWETERAKLKSQINRLEGAVAEAIARASNPMRATQSVKEQFEVELSRVAKEKTELEQAFLRAKTDWEQEKLKMTGEMVKLRRAAQIMGRPIPKEDVPEVNPKVRDLENQLRESLNNWNQERTELTAEIHKLQESARLWDAERRQLNDHAGQLQQAFMQSQATIQTYEVASRTPNPSEQKVQELKTENDKLQRHLQEAQSGWEAERRRFEQQLQRMSETRSGVSNEVVDQLRKQYEDKLQEAISHKTQLAQELQTASSLLEAQRSRLSAAQASHGTSLNTEVISAEVARVEGLITAISAITDNPETDFSTVIRKNVEKAELDSYLKGIKFCLGQK
jgi:DNA repair exonuclease SbcCD ATPase subunit